MLVRRRRFRRLGRHGGTAAVLRLLGERVRRGRVEPAALFVLAAHVRELFVARRVLRGAARRALGTRRVHGVRPRVPHHAHGGDLVLVPQVRPRIEGLGLRDVAPDVAVKLRAVDADEHAVWQDAPPAGTRRTIGAALIIR